jgi:hypothetical protein
MEGFGAILDLKIKLTNSQKSYKGFIEIVP